MVINGHWWWVIDMIIAGDFHGSSRNYPFIVKHFQAAAKSPNEIGIETGKIIQLTGWLSGKPCLIPRELEE